MVSSAEVTSRSLKADDCALQVKALSLTFANGVEIFDRIDFSVGDGERVAIIGRNGAGKSTLLRASLGMIPLSRSEGAWLYGEPMHNISGRRRRQLLRQVGFVHQKHNLVPRASALTNVVHGAWPGIARASGYGARPLPQAICGSRPCNSWSGSA